MVKHVRTYISYMSLPIFLLRLWTAIILYIRCFHPPGVEEFRTGTPTNPFFASLPSMPRNHQQQGILHLIRRRCVLTQAPDILRPVRPVRPDMRRNVP